MKKSILFVVVIFCLFLLVGCDKKPEITGNWKMETGMFSYQFNKDGSGTYDVGMRKIEITYTLDEKSIFITYEGTTQPTKLDYSINEEKTELTITDSFGTETKYIKK